MRKEATKDNVLELAQGAIRELAGAEVEKIIGNILDPNTHPDKPIWKLKPYRSFIEAPLAEVSFLLRIDNGFNVGLFECDGGKWEIDAKSNVREFVAGEIGKFPKELSERIFVIS